MSTTLHGPGLLMLFGGLDRLLIGGGGVISDASMARLMERRGLKARPHGFRSTLRVWLTESQQASREVAETIIAHQTGTLTERAYNRTDFLEQRRELMEAWERHLKSTN